MGGSDGDGQVDSIVDSTEDVSCGLQSADKERIEKVKFSACSSWLSCL